MKILAVNTGDVIGITKGKVYKVLVEEIDYYLIKNDKGNERKLYKWRFDPLDCEICEKRKCNTCPINKGKKYD